MNRTLIAKAQTGVDVSRLAAYLSPAKRAELELRLRKNGKTPRQLAIPQRANRDSAPLSFGQQRLWFLDQLDPNSAVYTTARALSMSGPLKIEALLKALHTIIARHESLRTTFICINDIPRQVIGEKRSELSLIDLADWPDVEKETEIQRLIKQEVECPFDLSHDSPLRATLLRRAEEEHLLLLMTHDIIFDGWSEGVFFQELGAFYGSFVNGAPALMSPLPIQYPDFSYWQRQSLEHELLEEQLSYWKLQLGNSPPVLELPTDYPRPPEQTFQGAAQSRALPASLSDALKRLGQEEGCTLLMTLLAAFKTLLHRYTGQEDILVGTPVAGRNRVELEGLIGSFVNTLVLRTDLSGDPTFRELLGRVREVALGAYAHQDFPFEKLVDKLRPERSLSRTPLFQVMFVLQDSPKPELEFPGLNVSRLEIERRIAKFDLTLEIIKKAEGLTCVCEHNIDLFDAATITRMLGHFQTLLEGIVANPDERLSTLPLLTGAERQQLLVTWNNSEANFPKGRCVHQLFEAQVKRSPDTVAVVFGNQRLTYSALNAKANQLAHHLRKRGVGPDVLVGIYLEQQSLEMIIGLLGVLKAGGAYVPLDSQYPKERLDFMLESTQVSIVLTRARLTSRHLLRRAQVVWLDSGWDVLAQESEENPASATAPENLVCVLYTSGSTGKPKGVMVTHGSLVNAYLAWEDAYQLRSKATTCHLQMASFSFDVFAGDLVRALCSGAKLVVCPPVAPRQELYELMLREKVDCAEFVPVSLRTLIQYLREAGQSLTFMRLLIAGSDSWYVNEYQEIRSFCGPETRLINSYGVTEATIDSSYFESCGTSFPVDGLVPIGRPFVNTQLYVLDPRLQLVPIGVPGELHIGGAGLARGYINSPELTADRFIPYPFSNEPGARLYKTGDLARYLPDGNIEFRGRIDNQIKIRGFRIEPGEVEAILMQHPAVREALVMAREDGPDSKRLVAYIVTGQLPEPTITELRNFLMQRLPEYMVPSALVFMDAFPVTPNGKLNRLALPVPSHTRPKIDNALLAPRDMLELQLTAIWENVLGIKPIGVGDNFFELGGDSLLAVHLFVQIQKVIGKNLPLAILFQGPTIEQLANILRREGWSTSSSSLVAIQPDGDKRPFFIVHALGGHILGYRELARCLGPEQSVYGLQAQGLDGQQAPYTRIEDMARHYIKEMRTLLPEGPYFLGGYSLGGIVAFEMARQLQAQDQKIGLLALLDCYPPTLHRLFEKAQSFCYQVSYLGQRVIYHWGNLSKLGPKEKLDYVRQIKNRIWQTGDVTRAPLPSTLQLVTEANIQALREYVPQSYQGRITLFRASERSRRTRRDPDLGWGELAVGGVEIFDVPGDHATLIEEPRVRILAEKLKTCLEKARQNGRGTRI